MNTPRTRAEFERNFHLLHRKDKEGGFHVPAEFKSLNRVRLLPNGRLDFLSVDEFARLEANTMANLSDGLFEDQMKQYNGPTEPLDSGSDAKSPCRDSEGKSH
jgi:hypothetical protein